jgi:hypothetical protein
MNTGAGPTYHKSPYGDYLNNHYTHYGNGDYPKNMLGIFYISDYQVNMYMEDRSLPWFQR